VAEDSDPDSKTEDATPRKLEEARRKGDVAKSPDVAQTLSLMGATAVVIFGGGYFATQMANAFVPFIASPHTMLGVIDSGSGAQIGMTALWAVAPFLGAVMLATILGGVGGNVGQMGGLIFSPDKLAPKWDKVSPMAGFKRLFGPDNFMHFGMTLAKLIAVGVICWMVLKPHMREFENLAAMSPLAILPLTRDLAVALMASALVFLGAERRERAAGACSVCRRRRRRDYPARAFRGRRQGHRIRHAEAEEALTRFPRMLCILIRVGAA
jgi:flagellar biosynthetic protein FlhB